MVNPAETETVTTPAPRAAARAAAAAPAAAFDGRHVVVGGIVCREVEPGVWKISGPDGAVAMFQSDTEPTLEQAQGVLPKADAAPASEYDSAPAPEAAAPPANPAPPGKPGTPQVWPA